MGGLSEKSSPGRKGSDEASFEHKGVLFLVLCTAVFIVELSQAGTNPKVGFCGLAPPFGSGPLWSQVPDVTETVPDNKRKISRMLPSKLTGAVAQPCSKNWKLGMKYNQLT